MKTWVIPTILVVLLVLAASGAVLASKGADKRSGSEPDTPVGNQPGDLQPSPTSDSDTLRQVAQVTGTSVVVAESYPPQYFIRIEFGLQNSCMRPGGYEVNRSGDAVTVTVYVTKPAPQGIICAQVFHTDSYNVPLGSDFESKKAYAVTINGQPTPFTAQ